MDLEKSVAVDCPSCQQEVAVHERTCSHCGVDLALAAVREEQAFSAARLKRKDTPPAPEALLPRLGELLIEAGLITEETLQHALDRQLQYALVGERVLLGQVLIEMGAVDRHDLDEVVATHIFQLHNALEESNRLLEERVRERTVALQHALIRLAELNQLKANFVANVSHELRTPLQFLVSYIDLMRDNALGDITKEQAEALDVMGGAGRRLKSLIEELLHFAGAARGDLPLDLRPLEIEIPVRTAVEQSLPKARERKLAFQTRLAPYMPIVRADEDKITWVIGELLDNAIKFTPAGGKIALAAARNEKAITIAVRDTGIGIPKPRISEIFEPFHQLDGSSTRHYGGMGLGLALAQNIIQAHGSSIDVQSEPGRGSCFSFSLPVAL